LKKIQIKLGKGVEFKSGGNSTLEKSQDRRGSSEIDI
jgi:hypothetical protein